MASALAIKINQILRIFVYLSFVILSFVFIFKVWKRKTLYTRWIILFFPLITFIFQGIFNNFLSGIIKVIIVCGFLNILLIVFYSASTIALWNKH